MPTNLVVKSLRLPRALLEELDYLKREYNINPSAFMRVAIEDGIVKLRRKLEEKNIRKQATQIRRK